MTAGRSPACNCSGWAGTHDRLCPAGRSPDAPTDRAGDGHRQTAMAFLREWFSLGEHAGDWKPHKGVRNALAEQLAAAEQRGRDEVARKVLRLAVMYDRLADHEDMHSAACDAFHDAALDIRRALADRNEATT